MKAFSMFLCINPKNLISKSRTNLKINLVSIIARKFLIIL